MTKCKSIGLKMIDEHQSSKLIYIYILSGF